MHSNIPVVGTVYHVVKKDTGRTIKVGSTIQPLHKRAKGYKKKYPDCFLREVFRIQSSPADDNWYGFAGVHQPKKAFCPFLWRLVHSEHLEILKMGTFRILDEPRSNQQFPIFQKLDGFDGADIASIGGQIGGRRSFILHGSPWTLAGSAKGGRAAGRKNVESGHLVLVASKGGRRCAELHPDLASQRGYRVAELHPDLASRRGHIGGHRRNELYGNPGTSQGRTKGGRRCAELHPDLAKRWGHMGGVISGRLAVESGRIQALGKSGIGGRRATELHPDLASRRGHIGGRRTFELHGNPGTPEGRAKAGRKNLETGHIQRLARIANCLRWNINRGKECVCGTHNAAKAA